MRWQGKWRWRAAERRFGNSVHCHTFGKNVGYIEAIIGADRVFCFRLATSYALLQVSSQAGNFEESGQAINLLLAVAFLGNRGITSQAWEGGRRYGTRCTCGVCDGTSQRIFCLWFYCIDFSSLCTFSLWLCAPFLPMLHLAHFHI